MDASPQQRSSQHLANESSPHPHPCSCSGYGVHLVRVPYQAAHSPLHTPTEAMFTKEQLATLSSVRSEVSVRMDFAQILYFLDISVRVGHSRVLHLL